MAKKQKLGFFKTASQGPAVVLIVLGLALLLPEVLFPNTLGVITVTGTSVELFGLILIVAGIISIYLLGGIRRQALI
ncbi:MAG: hypothetical protein KGH64_00815 [Candidatus Micrarchaeota archaeon]|nr:hypothetical protein [Candidatus Micrarchaeota archaeon]